MRIVCNECHGAGQRSYFKGESRFVLSQDECPACAGLGSIEAQETDPSGDEDAKLAALAAEQQSGETQ